MDRTREIYKSKEKLLGLIHGEALWPYPKRSSLALSKEKLMRLTDSGMKPVV